MRKIPLRICLREFREKYFAPPVTEAAGSRDPRFALGRVPSQSGESPLIRIPLRFVLNLLRSASHLQQIPGETAQLDFERPTSPKLHFRIQEFQFLRVTRKS